MSEYEIRSVGGHVEVYTRGGVFLFSADTVRIATLLEHDKVRPRVL